MTENVSVSLSPHNDLFFLGSPGGVLFETYLIQFGSTSEVKHLAGYLEGKVAEADYDPVSVFRPHAPRFWYCAALSLYRANPRCSLLLVHYTMQLEYRGLSRMGRALAAAFGGVPAVRSYDLKKEGLVASYEKRVKKMIRTNQCILTWDNYCHVYGSPILSADRDVPYAKANYTVVAVSAYEFTERPSFCWRWLDKKIAVASIPRDITDLEPFKVKVKRLLVLLCVRRLKIFCCFLGFARN